VRRRRLTVGITSVALVLNAFFFVLLSVSRPGRDAFWLLDGSSGAVTLALMSATVVLGVVRGGMPAADPRLVEGLHVNIATVTIGFAAVHVLSTILSEHIALGPVDALVPFASSYRTPWLGLGVISGYVYVAVFLASWPVRRLPPAAWRWLHRSLYLAWALALVHALGSGLDAFTGPFLLLDIVAVVVVLVAVVQLRLRRA
jgi:hypothetical protein